MEQLEQVGEEVFEGQIVLMHDAREQTSDEQLEAQEHQGDFPTLAIFGVQNHLVASWKPGLAPLVGDDEADLVLSRQTLQGLWPLLTQWVHTGEWFAGEELPQAPPIVVTLDPFERETLYLALAKLKQEAKREHEGATLYTDVGATHRRDQAEARIREIEGIEFKLDLAGGE